MAITDPTSVRQAAETLLAQHGCVGWRFEFDDSLKRRGSCSYTRKVITFSTHYLSSPPAAILNTILHEVAHAIVGPRHHHDRVWKATAKRIGCTGERCSSGHIDTRDRARYTLECRTCGRQWRMHKVRDSYYRCPDCSKILLLTDNHA